jgi:membrane fusion protein (multidrug efflux system)
MAGILLAALLLSVWLTWAFLARLVVYEVTETARLEVDRAVHVVQAPVAGRVVATHVQLGQEVERGTVLVALDAATERLRADEARSQLGTLAHQIQALNAEINAATAALQASQLASHVALEEARAHLRQAHVAAQFAAQDATRAQGLHTRGYLSEADWQRAQAQADQEYAARERLRLAVSRLQQEHDTQARDRQVRLEALMRERTRLEGEQSTAQRTLERLTHETSRRRILAPVAGRIGEVRALRQGSVVEEGDLLVAIVPVGDLMVVADFAPAAALGRLQRGQPARLRLDSFNWAQYGTVAATVARVASEAHNGRVRVELQVQPAPISVIPLQHGLTGTIEVEVERVAPVTLVLRAAGQLLAMPQDTLTARAAGAPPGAK